MAKKKNAPSAGQGAGGGRKDMWLSPSAPRIEGPLRYVKQGELEALCPALTKRLACGGQGVVLVEIGRRKDGRDGCIYTRCRSVKVDDLSPAAQIEILEAAKVACDTALYCEQGAPGMPHLVDLPKAALREVLGQWVQELRFRNLQMSPSKVQKSVREILRRTFNSEWRDKADFRKVLEALDARS